VSAADYLELERSPEVYLPRPPDDTEKYRYFGPPRRLVFAWLLIAAAGVLYLIASGTANFDVHAGFASNGYGANSPWGYSLLACFVAEVVLTAFFLIVIMGATDNRAPKGFAPIAIGLCLTLIHLVGIPVTNTSVNPARSTGPAIFAGGWALQQLWMFWLAPLIGGALGGGIYNALFGE